MVGESVYTSVYKTRIFIGKTENQIPIISCMVIQLEINGISFRHNQLFFTDFKCYLVGIHTFWIQFIIWENSSPYNHKLNITQLSHLHRERSRCEVTFPAPTSHFLGFKKYILMLIRQVQLSPWNVRQT